MPPCDQRCRQWALAVAILVPGCGEHGLFLTSVEAGPDFSVAEVVFDEGYYYCQVEPVLFAQSCGPGDPSKGDAANGCHHSVTAFRLTDYMPLVAERCAGGLTAELVAIPPAAQQNYQSAQARMRQNPDAAPLLLRAVGRAQHPREIFSADSPEAQVIRQWATRYSTQ